MGSGAHAPYPPSGPYGNVATNESRFTIHYGFALLAIFSLLGTLLIGVPMLGTAGDADDPDAGSMAGGMAVLWFLWGGMWTVIWTAFAIQHTLKGRRK